MAFCKHQMLTRRQSCLPPQHSKAKSVCSSASVNTANSKQQIVYDLHQLPRDALSNLRDSLLSALGAFRAGPKPIRMQLCVCLANLAIQMTEWKDVLQLVVSTLGNDAQSIPCVLDFLRVLPEEVTDGRKINLTVRWMRKPKPEKLLLAKREREN